jgi:hypothetical protein
MLFVCFFPFLDLTPHEAMSSPLKLLIQRATAFVWQPPGK